MRLRGNRWEGGGGGRLWTGSHGKDLRAREWLIWETDPAWNVLGGKSSKKIWEVIAVVQVKDSGLDQGDGNGNGETQAVLGTFCRKSPYNLLIDWMWDKGIKKAPKFLARPTANVALPSTELGKTESSWFRGTELEFNFEHVRLRCLWYQSERSNSQLYL